MKIKGLIDFFLYSNIFISACALTMAAETYLLLHADMNWPYIAFAFFSTLALYIFPTFSEGNFSIGYSERHAWVARHKRLLLILFIISVIANGILVFFFPFKFILYFIPVAVIAFAYFFPQTHLRSITGLKAGVVTLIWTSVTAIFPLLLISELDVMRSFQGINGEVILQNFFFMFPLCVIFNVRDIEADRKAGVKTFPVIYGVKATIAVCIISILAFSAMVVFSAFGAEIKIALLLSAALTAYLLLIASEKRTDYYYSLWIDGMILLQAILLILVHVLKP